MRTNVSLTHRFFRTLVQEIRKEEPSYLKRSFTVAEIYQSLVPYRTHRDRIGAEMNGDYEDALLRLLSGEGDYLILESDAARDRIRRELRSSNPNTGLYREYAAVGVRLNSDLAEGVEGPDVGERQDPDEHGTVGSDPDLEDDAASRADLPVSDDELDELVGRTLGGSQDDLGLDELLGEALDDDAHPRSGGDGGSGLETTDPVHETSGSSEPTSPSADAPAASRAGTSALNQTASSPEVPVQVKTSEIPEDVELGEVPDDCPDCARALPSRSGLHFCPFCGVNVFVFPCTDCGEILERGWSFCVACGSPAA
jgi:hypothetical protein